jgi:Tol biopolymer transport system component/tRNA A-37 threonylcarbamoyl transferase component Bud32
MPDSFDRLTTALADRYAIEHEIGRGGMATVYLAQDLRHDRQVAIKVLRPDLAATLGPERFHREIKIAAQLQHPHILPLLDSGEADDVLYYVMPYVEGESLRDRLDTEGELPIGEAVRIVRDVVDALTEAHAHGVVHRDIKPENILLRGRHALVTDFGVAKAVSEATGRARLTTAGVALGTPAYMAPEQASADPHLDHRVDIYAVGAVAYELLAGRPVFMGRTPQQVLAAHVAETPQPVTQWRETVPEALDGVVMRCLEKRPADRWQSAEELLSQLEALATPSGGVTPIETRTVAADRGRRRWVLPVMAGGVAAVVALAFVGTRFLERRPITVTVSDIRPVTSSPERKRGSSALSPDGSQVAFVAVRERADALVIKSAGGAVEGGEVTVIPGETDARLRALNWPTWSPDGESIRFRACRYQNRWNWRQDCTWLETGGLGGAVRRLDLPGTYEFATWSPDGSRVALANGNSDLGSDSLLVHDADGTTHLLAVSPQAIFWPSWSPDGRRIAYMSGLWELLPYPSSSSIWIVDADGGDPLQVTHDAAAFSPTWLDADHLAFLSGRDGPREMYVVEVADQETPGVPQKVAGVADALTIRYSVPGRTLSFIKASLRQNVWAFPLGQAAVSIADGEPVTRVNALVYAYDISPDGRRIAYSSDRGRSDVINVYTQPLGGGSATRLAGGPLPQSDPRWSPDGTEIAYYEYPTLSSSRLMVASADGRTSVQVDSARWTWRPSWSPSGLDLAYMADRTGQVETWVASRENLGGPWGAPRQLTDFNCWPMDWAPDGSGVLCFVNPPGGPSGDLVLMSPEGDELWRYDPATDGLALLNSYSVFSPDGSILYTWARHEDGTDGIWAIPVQGSEPRLAVAFDDPGFEPSVWLAARADHLYLTVGEVLSDVWVADVEVGR